MAESENNPHAEMPPEREIFEGAATQHIGWVYALARRQLTDATLADDATQAVFIALWKKRKLLFDPLQPIGGWLARATYYACNNIKKAERRRKCRERAVAAMRSERSRVADDATGLTTMKLLIMDTAMQKLSKGDRDILISRFFQDRNIRQVAVQFRISEAAAKKRVTRAVTRLRNTVMRQGLSLDDAGIAAVMATGTGRMPGGLMPQILKCISGRLPPIPIATGALGSISCHLSHKPIIVGVTVTAVTAAAVVPLLLNNRNIATVSASAAPATRIPIGYNTTRLTTPLTKSGLVDYVAAYYRYFSKGVTVKNNAAIPLVALLQTHRWWSTSAFKRRFLIELGVTSQDLKGPHFIRYSHFIQAADPTAIFHSARFPPAPQEVEPRFVQKPWAESANPWLAAWLRANAGALYLAQIAVRRSAYFMPHLPLKRYYKRGLVACQLPFLTALRSLAVGLTAQAMLDLHENHISACEKDIQAVHRLARLMAHGGTLIEYAIAYILESMANKGDRALIHSPRFTAVDAGAYLAWLKRLQPFPRLVRSINTVERWRVLGVIEMATQPNLQRELDSMFVTLTPVNAGPQPNNSKPLAVVAGSREAYIRDMRFTNGYFDAVIATLNRHHTLASRLKAIVVLARDARPPLFNGHRLDFRGLNLAKLFIPSFSWPVTMAAVLQASDRMDILRFALIAYYGQHHHFPDNLYLLTPGYLPSIPVDPLEEKPFAYTKTESGCTISMAKIHIKAVSSILSRVELTKFVFPEHFTSAVSAPPQGRHIP